MDSTISVTFTVTKTMMTMYFSDIRPNRIGTPSKVIVSNDAATTTSSSFPTVISISTLSTEFISLGISNPGTSSTISGVSTPTKKPPPNHTGSTRHSVTATHSSTATYLSTTNGAHSINSDHFEVGTAGAKTTNAALGLAIGIPVGLFGLVLIGLGTWYYFKQKRKTNDLILPMENLFYDASSFTKKNPYLQKYVSKETPDYGQRKAEQKVEVTPVDLKKDIQGLTPLRLMSVPQRIKRESINFLKSFSRVGKIEETDESQPILPLFLKRFNLNKPFTPYTPEDYNPKYDYSNQARDLKDYPKPIKADYLNGYSSRSTSNTSSTRSSSPAGPTVQQKSLPKLPSLIQMETPIEDSKFRAIKTYKKKLTDELDLNVNDLVKILKIHNDGWCLIRNEFGKVGMVPRNYLELE